MTQTVHQLFYLKVSILVLTVWFVVFLLKKHFRREMLFMGVTFGIFGPIQELWYVKDYWHPLYVGNWPWIEDIFFGFAMAGIASVLYEAIFRKREFTGQNPHHFVFISAALVGTVGGLAFFSLFMNSIYAAILGFWLAWLMIILFRKDLLIPSLWSAFLMLILTAVAYSAVLQVYPTIVRDWWYLKGLSGIFVLGVPLEEYLWFASLGLIMGPLYDLFKGIRFSKFAT